MRFAINILTKFKEGSPQIVDMSRVNKVMIYICGHGARDSRCGVLGPLLQDQFEGLLHYSGIGLPGAATSPCPWILFERLGRQTQTQLISHVGGHKFAGNVIICFPLEAFDTGFATSRQLQPLAGCSIWYGRVEPRHVEGILRATIGQGRIIKELFRGGLNKNGEPLSLEDLEAVEAT